MFEIVQNVSKLVKMVKKGTHCSKLKKKKSLKWSKMIKNGSKWFWINQNGQHDQIVQHGSKCFKMVRNGENYSKCSKLPFDMVQNCVQWIRLL